MMNRKYLLVGIIGFIIGGSLVPINATIPPTNAIQNLQLDGTWFNATVWNDSVILISGSGGAKANDPAIICGIESHITDLSLNNVTGVWSFTCDDDDTGSGDNATNHAILNETNTLTETNTFIGGGILGMYDSIVLGDGTPVPNNDVIQIVRDFNYTSGHGYEDRTRFDPLVDGMAYASYDCLTESIGNRPQSHVVCYEARNVINVDNITDFAGGFMTFNTQVNNGTVTDFIHYNVFSDLTGDGSVDTQYGFHVPDLTFGDENYAWKSGLGLVDFGDDVNVTNGDITLTNGNVNFTTALTGVFFGDGDTGIIEVADDILYFSTPTISYLMSSNIVVIDHKDEVTVSMRISSDVENVNESPAVLDFQGNDDAQNPIVYSRLQSLVKDNSTGATAGGFDFQVDEAGALVSYLEMNAATNEVRINKKLSLTAGAQLIASGVMTANTSYELLIGEGFVADDLVTINGGQVGTILVIGAFFNVVDVTVKSTGNIVTSGSDFVLDNSGDTISFIFNATHWLELSRSDNGS